jgi:antitoxin component HigA of HigAB toxin-antitoxin module
MKMGTIPPLSRYDAAARHALQSVNLRQLAILRYASRAVGRGVRARLAPRPHRSGDHLVAKKNDPSTSLRGGLRRGAEIERYFENEPKPGTPEADRFDLLALIIEDYERKRWPIEPPDTIDAIRYRMETGGYTQADLGRLLGSRQRASDILTRKRALTMRMGWLGGCTGSGAYRRKH